MSATSFSKVLLYPALLVSLCVSYHIYKKLALNLRIKPCKRLVHEKPEALKVPQDINQVWSMDFMYDQLEDGRT